MIELLAEKFSFESVKDVKKGLILCSVEDRDKVTGIIKQWIAHIMHKYYFNDPKVMIEAKEHILQFQCINWLKDKIILITNE